MDVSDFDFELPEELIAQQAVPRGGSRLLRLDRASGQLSHAAVSDLPAILKSGDLLVANDTRVFPARLLGNRVPSGGAVECLLLAPVPPSPTSDPRSPTPDPRSPAEWTALMHPGQKLKAGALVRFEHPAGVLMAEVLERQFFGRRRIRLWAESGGEVDALVDAMGHVPLPP